MEGAHALPPELEASASRRPAGAGGVHGDREAGRARRRRIPDPDRDVRLPCFAGWVRAPENVWLIGVAGAGKSHMLGALGTAAVEAGRRVRNFTAATVVADGDPPRPHSDPIRIWRRVLT